jgi:hypothetical protein
MRALRMKASPDTGAQRDDPFAHVRRSFLGNLGDRCLAIDAILERNGGQDIGGKDREVIIHHTHKTAGVAASLGFPKLGELAREVETAWMREPRTDPELSAAIDLTHRFLDEIERILDEDLNA